MEAVKPKSKKKTSHKKIARHSPTPASDENTKTVTETPSSASSVSTPILLCVGERIKPDEASRNIVGDTTMADNAEDNAEVAQLNEQETTFEKVVPENDAVLVDKEKATQIEKSSSDSSSESKANEQTDVNSVPDFTPTAPPYMAPTMSALYPDLSQLRLDANIGQGAREKHAETIEISPNLAQQCFDEQRLNDWQLERAMVLYNYAHKQMAEVTVYADKDYLNVMEENFVITEQPSAVDKDPGYDGDLQLSLLSYRAAYHNFCDVVKERTTTHAQLSQLRSKYWEFQEETFSAFGSCADNRSVSVKHKSRTATLNVQQGKEAKASLTALLDNCVLKEKEALLLLRHTSFMAEKSVSDPPKPQQDLEHVLRYKLRILGNALRTEMRDRCDAGEKCKYLLDLRIWFVNTGTTLLHAGNVQNAVWLMFHLLRFPNGIGGWAHVLVHPLSVTADRLPDDELQNVLTITHVLLRPILERQTFLIPMEDVICNKAVGSSNECDTANGTGTKPSDTFEWVDSDGEESSPDKRVRPIKESDLLALLDQIPFQLVFRTITSRAIECVEMVDGAQLRSSEMLRLITFSKKLITILGEGLTTYRGTDRYHHFTQRLALLINDTVKFVSDVFGLYRTTQNGMSEGIALVQVQFDVLVHWAAGCIYAGGISLSRHLSTLPFALLGSPATWWFYHCLLLRDFSVMPTFSIDRAAHTSVLERFIKQLMNEAPKHVYNVLKPFADLALARSAAVEREFICTVTETLFEILVSIDTHELVCSEIIMEQLHIIMEKHMFALSAVLQTLITNDAEKTQRMASAWETNASRLLEVFNNKKICIGLWHPTEADINVLLEMLVNYVKSHIYHKLALGLLMYINYGQKSSTTLELNVPKQLQQRILYGVVHAFRKNNPTIVPEANAADHDELVNYQERCLYLLLQLRVHLLDQPPSISLPIIEVASSVELRDVPSIETLTDLKAGVDKRCPVACLGALLTTTIGHWVPVFCQDGLTLLEHLLEKQLDTIVIRCLELIVLLFVESPHALRDNERFVRILSLLVQNDTELVWATQNAKQPFGSNLLSHAKVGKLETMLVSQVELFWRCGFKTPALLVRMWCEYLVQLPNWTNNAKVLRLLNTLASISFGHTDAWDAMREWMRPTFRTMALAKQKQPGLQLLWAKITGNEPPLLYGAIPDDCIALALLAFEVEHLQLERETNLWSHFLGMLKKHETIKLGAVLKELHNEYGCGGEDDFCPSPDTLVFFKLGRFLVRTKIEHPLYLALCQQFFTILLARDVTNVGNDVYGVSDRLSGCDVGLMEKLKKMLCGLEVHYHALLEAVQNGKDINARDHAQRMLSLVKAFQLWLVDTQLNRIAIDDSRRLPLQYDVPHLRAAFLGIQDYWHECIDGQFMLTLHHTMADRWKNLYRLTSSRTTPFKANPTNPDQPYSPINAIKRRLAKAYTDPAPEVIVQYPPELRELRIALQKPPMERVKRITESLRVLKQHIDKTHWSTKAELDRRKTELSQLFAQLYVNEDQEIVKQVKCSILYCAGAATVKVRIKHAVINAPVEERIETHLRDLDALLQMAINIPPYIVHHTILLRELWNSLFVDYCTETDCTNSQALNVANRTMLRTLLHELNDANFLPPLTYAVRLSLDNYKSDLSNLMFDEVSRLFVAALEQGGKPSNVIVGLLEDIRIPCGPLICIYNQLVKQKGGCLERNLFLEMFGNKLDMSVWSKEHDIATDEVDQFARMIVVGLYKVRPMDATSPARVGEQDEIDERFSDMLISHLVLFGTSAFPEHFGKILQHILNAYSQWPTLPPSMLLRLLNAVRSQLQLDDLRPAMHDDMLHAAHRQFAEANSEQSLLGFLPTEALMVAITEHFRRQRDASHPLNGMYKRHNAYIEVMLMLLGTMSYAYLALGMNENGIHFVQNNLLPMVYCLFEPWIVPHGEELMAPPTNYAQIPTFPRTNVKSSTQFNNDKAKWMFNVLLRTINYTIEKGSIRYPESEYGSQILLNFLNWYLDWFTDARMMIPALSTYNPMVLTLGWEDLHPSELLIERMHSMLEYHSPECHELLANIFVRCRWVDGGKNVARQSCPEWLLKTHASTLAICVRLSYEPVVRTEQSVRVSMARILNHFAQLQWTTVHLVEIAPAFDWFVMTAESSIMLRSPKTVSYELDEALIGLLEVVAGMRSNDVNPIVSDVSGGQLLKRKIYISVATRMLMNVGRLLNKGSTVAAVRLQLASAIRGLLQMVMLVIATVPTKNEKHVTCPRWTEAHGMIAELMTSANKWQTDHGMSIFADEFIRLLESESNSPLIVQCVLKSVSQHNSLTAPLLRLIESALHHYFQIISDDETQTNATWLRAIDILGQPLIGRWPYEMLTSNNLPLCLQLSSLYRAIETKADMEAQLTHVEQLMDILPQLKIVDLSEARLYPLWCTVLYSLLTLNAVRDDVIRKAIGLFGTVSENSSYWVVGILKKILGREKTPEKISVTRCLIAYGFAALLASGYARRAEPNGSERDDYSNPESGETFTLAKLLTSPEKRASKGRIASMAIENLTSACSTSSYKELQGRLQEIVQRFRNEEENGMVLQRAIEIVTLFDSTSEPFLRSLPEALCC